jgi:Vacuolar sorting protein 9 (VPS9) domain
MVDNNSGGDQHDSLQLRRIRNQNHRAIMFDHPALQGTPNVGLTSHTSFLNVNEALQENIVANFLKNSPRSNDDTENQKDMDLCDSSVLADNSLKDHDSNESPNSVSEDTTLADTGLESNGESVDTSTTSKISAAAVAGGIAGGLAGLAFAGPAGAYAGFAAASYMVEGTVALGVVVAGIAYGSKYGPQIEEHVRNSNVLEILPRRVLTMSENGSNRKVLLVRPHIQIDLYWENTVMLDARKTAPVKQSTFVQSTLSLIHYKKSEESDADIVRSDENEISCSDKVLLLVNRIINDRQSLPGHIFHYLVNAYRHRCDAHQTILAECDTSNRTISPRIRRDDAHAVIIHLTATLLETRKEFDSPCITELVATAVEGLVLTQLYDLIMEEISEETTVLDNKLQENALLLAKEFYSKKLDDNCRQELKVSSTSHRDDRHEILDEESAVLHIQSSMSVSQEAMLALLMLGKCYTSFDKLQLCVQFLELISEEHCRTSNKGGCILSADSLLKRVCQHILIHVLSCHGQQKPCNINGQIGFIEEFARDEQLLRGREGYALVTLQASLHFLNNSSLTDIKAEIFEDSNASTLSTDQTSVNHESQYQTDIKTEIFEDSNASMLSTH